MSPPNTGTKAVAIELREVTKRFGAVLANDRVSVRVPMGSIYGIIGENGAGKSTAMNILYGMHQADSGEIVVEGEKRVWRSPAEAIAAGIGMVHQHFMLAGPHTALENIILGIEPSRFGFLDRKRAREKLQQLAPQHGFGIELDRPVDDLPVGIRQRIEIVKLLYRGARILILDEPTAVLTPQETQELFRYLQHLRDDGKTIILITHKLREVLAFTERVMVMRAGRTVAEMATRDTNAQQLADLMVGRKVNLRAIVSRTTVAGEPALQAENLSLRQSARRGRLDQVNLSVRRGEIVGVAGVEGNGQSELINALQHPRDRRCRTSGRVKILGKEVSDWPARKIRDLGVALIPEDRQHEGLLLSFSLRDNFVLGLHRSREFCQSGFLRWKAIAQAAEKSFARFDVRPGNLDLTARQLSGGNQQKLVAAREFYRQIALLIAAQPTRGVDVGAIEFIHQQIIAARDADAGILLISSDLEEILSLSDRILVLFEGSIVGEFKRGEVNEGDLGLRMAGGAGAAPAQ